MKLLGDLKPGDRFRLHLPGLTPDPSPERVVWTVCELGALNYPAQLGGLVPCVRTTDDGRPLLVLLDSGWSCRPAD